MKLRIIEIYNQKLDERIERKRFIVDRGILDYKKNEKRKSKEDKDIFDRLRIFARVLAKDEHEDLLNGLIGTTTYISIKRSNSHNYC